MRYSYGIMDQRRILLYQPQLFLKSKDLLVFPSADFHKWHGDIKEYLDGLYQLDFREVGKGKPVNMTDLNLALGVVNNITEELENLFDRENVPDFSYHYLSTLDKKYKKGRSAYTSDMQRVDLQVPVINPELKYKHLMEIVEEANQAFTRALEEKRMKKKEFKG
ncbi:hypothetical protein FGU46_10185 [Methanobacterium sp. CWC-01]|uniref:hypothetical protein n=1 Tax=Methanobacterium aridiramus TaxID=2584467 RepID=UPI002577E652|nr:hypothetical protein [Methanobacterium sp. CWC-01]WJI10430.1 hypothetical protein FGU46_10185 [Methanobacterium sp. CWC-01]